MQSSINYGGISTSTDVITLYEASIEPLVPGRPSEEVDATYVLTIGRVEKAWKWSLNGNHSYGLSLEAENPIIWNPEAHINSSLVSATKNNTWVDIIFAVSGDTSTVQPSHPIHKHSNPVYVLVSLVFDC